MRGAGIVGFSLLAAAVSASAFVVDIDSAGRTRRWSLAVPDSGVDTNVVNPTTHAIRLYFASDAYTATNSVAELNEVRACFDQWQAIPGATLKFELGGFVAPGVDVNPQDNTNVVFWAKTSTLVNGGMDDIHGILGAAFTSWFSDNVMAEADIVLNGVEFHWSTDPNAQAPVYFIDSVLLHEIGHFVGLEHSPAGGAVMLSRSESGTGTQAGLSSDDIAGARMLYPLASFASTLANFQGHVSLNGAPVLGAVITAEDAQGNVTAGTVSRADGSYQMSAMPPGNYQVRVTPLDPNGGQPLLVGGDIAPDYQGAVTGFLPTTPASLALVAGQSLTLDFPVSGGNPAFRIYRVGPPSANPNFFGVVNTPIAVTPGQSNVMIAVYSPNLPTANATFSISGNDLLVGPARFDPAPTVFASLNIISAIVSVPLNATPGMRSLIVRSGSDIAYANGFLVVVPLVPDHNFDGLDDRFQRQYFPRWTAPEAGPNADPDGDGFSNLAEYIAGTDPTDPTSYFKVAGITSSASAVTIQCLSLPGKHYQLLARPAFPGAAWQLASPVITATGNVTQWLDPVTNGATRFYRLQALP